MNNLTQDTVFNGAIPSTGPQSINLKIEIPFDLNPVVVDLKAQQIQGLIKGVQTIFIDTMNYDSDVQLIMDDTGQRIVAKSKTQGYYPILSTSLMKFKFIGESEGDFNCNFINFPIALGVWGFNVLKGDIGEKGEPGGNVITQNSTYSDGQTIASIDENNITLKKLIAGDNVEIIDNGETLLINSTATGGGGDSGGGGASASTFTIGIQDASIIVGANDTTAYLDFRDAAVLQNATFCEATYNGINFFETGQYLINIRYWGGQDTGKKLIKCVTETFDYFYAQQMFADIDSNFNTAEFTFSTFQNSAGKFKIACCNDLSSSQYFSVLVNITKLHNSAGLMPPPEG